ncbi:uncharacterized protein LOC123320843 [Coccinella septempunctata]|uniref:uncharacterized protein LOC123320843 n=1 Tax=Coccinella septempunctata TaxID=41139 RepID=UPI001D075C64|nr:uncharacterized protein LOC123320843 [Coccinella septempunctata]
MIWNISKKCLSKFGLTGGKDVAETTRKIIKLIIGHELAISLNWSGRNNKNGLEPMANIVKLIHGSVRRNPITKNATDMEMNHVIMNWLRNASDRAGGRLRRAEEKEAGNNE